MNYESNPHADFDRWDAEQARRDDETVALWNYASREVVIGNLEYLHAQGRITTADLLRLAANGVTCSHHCSGFAWIEDARDETMFVDRMAQLLLSEIYSDFRNHHEV